MRNHVDCDVLLETCTGLAGAVREQLPPLDFFCLFYPLPDGSKQQSAAAAAQTARIVPLFFLELHSNAHILESRSV